MQEKFTKLLLKGSMSPVECVFKAYTIKSVLSVHALMVFKFLSFASFFENTCSVSRLSFALIGRFFLCTFIAASGTFLASQGGYRTTFRDTGWYQKPEQAL